MGERDSCHVRGIAIEVRINHGLNFFSSLLRANNFQFDNRLSVRRNLSSHHCVFTEKPLPMR